MKPYYYVYRVGYKFPTAQHYTLTSANKEAERLSNQHPGDIFEILQCLAITRTVLAQTFWMDGVTPPGTKASRGQGVAAPDCSSFRASVNHAVRAALWNFEKSGYTPEELADEIADILGNYLRPEKVDGKCLNGVGGSERQPIYNKRIWKKVKNL